MRRPAPHALAAVFVFAVPALCVTPACRPAQPGWEPPWELVRGREFDHRPANLLTDRRSTRADAVRLLGEPLEATALPAGGQRLVWRAEYSREVVTVMLSLPKHRMETRVRELVVTLAPDGTVRDKIYSDEELKRRFDEQY
jgi:hypothetical protein